ncbi:MAG TPA: tyrosine-type recombinase/integrase [Thermoanaerobaculia bacterium]|nr:tyrosine-type recombinase/integrase [Thermoanaerobaculia bacterium]
MQGVNLTDRSVRTLAIPNGASRAEYWDRILPGFGVRVGASRRTYVLMYRLRGRLRRLTLGQVGVISLADARAAARRALAEAAEGNDPAERRNPTPEGVVTFRDLAQEYLERHAKRRKRTWRDDERMIRNELLPPWGDRPPDEIRRRDVIVLLDHVADRPAPIMANRLRALISKIFNFGIGRDLVEFNPAALVPRPGEERASNRALSDEEIKRVWAALEASDNIVMAGIVQMRLLLGQRTGEVEHMRWSDLDEATWRLPPEFTKNAKAHAVPLGPLALTILERLRPISGHGEWVFPSSRKQGSPVRQVQKFMVELRRASGVLFVARDLRRTFSTGLTRLGVPQLTVSKLLNHTIPGVTDRHYDRYDYDPEKQGAILLWDTHIRELARPI